MNRREFLRSLSFGAAACTLGMPETLLAQAGGGRPNVLFIGIDDLKPLLNCYGASQIISPNIDRLAKLGVIFANAQCQQAVCAPSRASLLTGLYPDSTGVLDLKTQMRDVNPDVLTLPQHFRNHGYATTGVGKTFDSRAVDENHDAVSWSHGYVAWPADQFNADFPQPVWGYQAPATRQRVEHAQELIRRTGKNQREIARQTPGSRPAFENADVPDDAYTDGAIAKHAMRKMEALAKADQPFFLSVGFYKPHLPFVAPKKYWNLYDPAKIDLADYQKLPHDGPDLAYQPGWELINGYSDVPEPRPFPEDYQRSMIHGYYACISYIDAQVGKLLDKLDELGIADQTAICLWGDHGWHLGDHDMWCKHSNFEQAVRSPLIIAPTPATRGYQRNATAEGVVGFVDIFPTLCDLAGLPVPAAVQGESLEPMLRDPNASVKQYAMSQFPRGYQGKRYMGYSLRSNRYRCTFWIPREVADQPDAVDHAAWIELYDYKTDPLETVNLAADPAHAEVVGEFRNALPGRLTLGRSYANKP